jgi:hypothetical protein
MKQQICHRGQLDVASMQHTNAVSFASPPLFHGLGFWLLAVLLEGVV